MNMLNSLDNYQQQFNLHYINSSTARIFDLRRQQFENFKAKGFPTRKNENWKYTDLAFLAKKEFALSTKPSEPITQSILDQCINNQEYYQLVFVDGYFAPSLSNCEDFPANVQYQSLVNLMKDDNKELLELLIHQEPAESLITLNTAFLTDGVYLSIPQNEQISRPIKLLFITTEKTHPTMYYPRNIIIMGENSKATIIEEHISTTKQSYFKNIVNQITVNSGAQLSYTKLQREGAGATHIAHTVIKQYRDSHVSSFSFSFGSSFARDDLHFALKEPGAQCKLYGLYQLTHKQHIDHHTCIDHFVPRCESYQHYKGIIDEQAVGIFNGKVVVHPQAQKTNAQQINQNLLLSKTAEVNTKPELEIYADDVKCAHGATVGQLDENSLFYLRARGIDLAIAKKMLTEAFANEIIGQALPILSLSQLPFSLRY